MRELQGHTRRRAAVDPDPSRSVRLGHRDRALRRRANPHHGRDLIVYLGGQLRPNASNLNFAADRTIANLVLVRSDPGSANNSAGIAVLG